MSKPPKYNSEFVDGKLKEASIKRIGEYINTRTPFRVKCLKDEYEWDILFHNFIHNQSRCPKCSNNNNIKLDNDEVDRRLEGRNIKRIGDYITAHIKIEFECLLDGHRWLAKPYKVLNQGRGCPLCSKHKGGMKIGKDEFIKRIKDRPLKMIGEFKGLKSKTKFKCLVDGYIWESTPSNIYYGNGCPECKKITLNEKQRLTNEVIRKRLKDKPLKMIGNYINKDTKIKWKCLVNEEHEWESTPGNIFRGSGCPYCYQKSEKLLSELIRKNVDFDLFKWHKRIISNNRHYVIDFYIEKGSKKIFIERNGEQHYEAIEYFGGEEAFEKQVKRDEEIREYCYNNKIDLIEIPYWLSEEDIINKLREI